MPSCPPIPTWTRSFPLARLTSRWVGRTLTLHAKLCINGNEYAECQPRKRGIEFQALDNGVLSCEDPKALQRIRDGLDDKKIDRLLRKWLDRLPHPFDRRDRMAGYRYGVSILQAKFALTQVLDTTVAGRIFFVQVIRSSARTWTSGGPARCS